MTFTELIKQVGEARKASLTVMSWLCDAPFIVVEIILKRKQGPEKRNHGKKTRIILLCQRVLRIIWVKNSTAIIVFKNNLSYLQ